MFFTYLSITFALSIIISSLLSETMARVYGGKIKGLCAGLILFLIGTYIFMAKFPQASIEFPEPVHIQKINGSEELILHGDSHWKKSNYSLRLANAFQLIQNLRHSGEFKIRMYKSEDVKPWAAALEVCISSTILKGETVLQRARNCAKEQHQLLKWLEPISGE